MGRHPNALVLLDLLLRAEDGTAVGRDSCLAVDPDRDSSRAFLQEPFIRESLRQRLHDQGGWSRR